MTLADHHDAVIAAALDLRRAGLAYQRAFAGADPVERRRAMAAWEAVWERYIATADALVAYQAGGSF